MRVVAHRTCPLEAPENSVEGIVGASALGADAVELDTRLTRDGEVVLLHDHWPLRVARPHLPIPVSWLPARATDRLRLRNGEPLPRFAAAIDGLPDGLDVAVDVKDGRSMAAAIAVLTASGKLDRAMLWSRHAPAVATAAERAPANERALLRNTVGPEKTLAYLRDAASLGATAVSVMDVSVSAEVVRAAHDLGLTIYAWVRTAEAHGAVIDAGPDGVVTDWVAQARRLVGARPL